MIGNDALLAAFVTPGLFTAGVVAAAAPVLIHLLARRRFKRMRWAAIDFLLAAHRRNRRRINLEEWVLLALRCLAVVLLGALMARPFIVPAEAGSAWSGTGQVERIFVLDDSYSMAYESLGSNSFDRAKAALRRLIEAMRSENPDNTVTLLRATSADEPLETGVYLDDTQTERLLARVAALGPSQQSMDPRAMVQGLVDTLESAPDTANAVVYVLSDFQRHDWVRPASAAAGKPDEGGILRPLAEWATKDRGLRVVFVNVGDRNATNIAVAEIEILSRQLVAETPVNVRTSIVNHGREMVNNLQLTAAIENLQRSRKQVDALDARQKASVEQELLFTHTGSQAVRFELSNDGLPLDNVRYAVAEVAEAVRILIVNGEPAVGEADDEVLFLKTALKPAGEVFSGNELSVIDETELEDQDLPTFHLVILANVYRLSEPAVDALQAFVWKGGGLLIALGDQVDADLYDTVLYRNGSGLLPAALTEVKRPADPVHLVISDRLHPVVRSLSREGDPLGIAQIAFAQFFGCEVATAPESGSGVSDSPAARPGSRVMATFDDDRQSPALVERPFGQGRVMLFTSSVDKEWNDWPNHPTYLPMMMEMVRHVARGEGRGLDVRVGDAIRLVIDPAVYEADVALRSPAYPGEPEAGVTAVPTGDGRDVGVAWEHTDVSGIYQFVLTRRDGGEAIKLASVNVDPREGDLTMADEDELRRAAGPVSIEYLEGVDRLTESADAPRTELWRVFLFLAAGALLAEQTLAWRWGGRR